MTFALGAFQTCPMDMNFTSPSALSESIDTLEHRKRRKYGCKVKGHFRKKLAAKKAACAARVRGRRARVGGTRGKYVVLDCGKRKPHRLGRRSRR